MFRQHAMMLSNRTDLYGVDALLFDSDHWVTMWSTLVGTAGCNFIKTHCVSAQAAANEFKLHCQGILFCSLLTCIMFCLVFFLTCRLRHQDRSWWCTDCSYQPDEHAERVRLQCMWQSDANPWCDASSTGSRLHRLLVARLAEIALLGECEGLGLVQ